MWRLPSVPQRIAMCFTEAGLHVTVVSRTAIQAPGGWASDREPAKRFDGRPRSGRVFAGCSFPKKEILVRCIVEVLYTRSLLRGYEDLQHGFVRGDLA
jgi:hypothetical protein